MREAGWEDGAIEKASSGFFFFFRISQFFLLLLMNKAKQIPGIHEVASKWPQS